jgi:hypothetical protein
MQQAAFEDLTGPHSAGSVATTRVAHLPDVQGAYGIVGSTSEVCSRRLQDMLVLRVLSAMDRRMEHTLLSSHQALGRSAIKDHTSILLPKLYQSSPQKSRAGSELPEALLAQQ